jgi:hypothetical protein
LGDVRGCRQRACELAIFSGVFLRGAVYDPVTANLLRALRIQP